MQKKKSIKKKTAGQDDFPFFEISKTKRKRRMQNGLHSRPNGHENLLEIPLPILPHFDRQKKPQLYLPEITDVIEEDIDPYINSGHNIGNFYGYMYPLLFNLGGVDYNHTESVEISDEETRTFSPDIHYIDQFTGARSIEVKAHAVKNRPHCSASQIENYFWALRHHREQGDVAPSIDFAFFSYNGGKSLNLHRRDEIRALEKLAETTSGLIVLPFNVALYALALSKTEERFDGESCRISKYWRIKGGLLSTLKKQREFKIDKFLEGYERTLGKERNTRNFYMERAETLYESKLFGLDDLVVTHTSSERKVRDTYGGEIQGLSFNGVRVQDFPITVYANKNYPRWIKQACKNYDRITSTLRVRNLYQEWADGGDIPF